MFGTTTASRRDAILGAVGAAIAAVGAAGFPRVLLAQSGVTVGQFLELSQRLTGATGLDQKVAQTLLGGFVAAGHGPALQDLLRNAASQVALADAIVAAWYSGLYDTGAGAAVSDFTGALVWNALDFTKPFAECGGEMGYWRARPSPEDRDG